MKHRPIMKPRSLGFCGEICDKFHLEANVGVGRTVKEYCKRKMKMTVQRNSIVSEIA